MGGGVRTIGGAPRHDNESADTKLEVGIDVDNGPLVSL